MAMTHASERAGRLTDTHTHKKKQKKHQEAVFRATAELLLEKGHRDLRTAEIAQRARITESTLFRTYGKLDQLLPATDNWAWNRVVRCVSGATFAAPSADPMQALLADTDAVCAMRENPDDELAATFAFLFFRRKHELNLVATDSERAFTDRVYHRCAQLIPDDAPHGSARLLTTLVLNYLATVWLTWLTMPGDPNDPDGPRDYSPAEAQIGVIMLLERFAAHEHIELTRLAPQAI